MESHIDIWSLMRTLAHCNGEGCHSYLPNCPDYADCKVDSDRILEFIEALIASEQKPMVEALKLARGYLVTTVANKIPLEDLAKIDAVLEGDGK